jgi:hypothetical protein
MLHVVYNIGHTKKNWSKLMHSIMIVKYGIGPTASSLWFDAVHLLQF